MKNLIMTFLLMVIFANAFCQDYTDNNFYKTFSRQFYLKSINLYRDYNGFHSILIKTNSKGQIISFTPSSSMTEKMKEDVKRGFDRSDKDAFVELNLKNKIIFFPVFFLSIAKFPDSPTSEMWKFPGDSSSLGNLIHFPPHIYLLPTRPPVIN